MWDGSNRNYAPPSSHRPPRAVLRSKLSATSIAHCDGGSNPSSSAPFQTSGESDLVRSRSFVGGSASPSANNGQSRDGGSNNNSDDRRCLFLSLFFVLSCFSPVWESVVPCVKCLLPFVGVSISVVSCLEERTMRHIKLQLRGTFSISLDSIFLYLVFLSKPHE